MFSIWYFFEHLWIFLQDSVAETSTPPTSKGRRHEAEAIEMRRGRAQPCLQRRARPFITLCQRHFMSWREKKETLSLTLSYIVFFIQGLTFTP